MTTNSILDRNASVGDKFILLSKSKEKRLADYTKIDYPRSTFRNEAEKVKIYFCLHVYAGSFQVDTKMQIGITTVNTRAILQLPEYQWWYNEIKQGDVDTIKNALTKSSEEQKDRLLNGKFVTNKEEKCMIKSRKKSNHYVFEATAPLTLALTYSAPKEVISVSKQTYHKYINL